MLGDTSNRKGKRKRQEHSSTRESIRLVFLKWTLSKNTREKELNDGNYSRNVDRNSKTTPRAIWISTASFTKFCLTFDWLLQIMIPIQKLMLTLWLLLFQNLVMNWNLVSYLRHVTNTGKILFLNCFIM